MFHITPEQDAKNTWLIKTMRGLEPNEICRLLDHGSPQQRGELMKLYNRIHIRNVGVIVAFVACILVIQFLFHLDFRQLVIVGAILIPIVLFLKIAQARKNKAIAKSILASISEKSKSSTRH
ncbi:hypothetical protein [Flavobacterium sp.]|uniref:hypothetical protein n=1 Tax=Flavobacterium sp. TaxID=239 RepID=UPI00261B63D4|nr:hypothetical protein [Flavobacterium sp.]